MSIMLKLMSLEQISSYRQIYGDNWVPLNITYAMKIRRVLIFNMGGTRNLCVYHSIILHLLYDIYI